MTTSALPARAASKNLQARTTGGILNIVRYAGTAVFGLIAAILVIAGFVEWADPHTSGLTAVLILIGVGTTTVARCCSTPSSAGMWTASRCSPRSPATPRPEAP